MNIYIQYVNDLVIVCMHACIQMHDLCSFSNLGLFSLPGNFTDAKSAHHIYVQVTRGVLSSP